MDTEDDEELGNLVVCRAVPGEHIGGYDCWCNPYVVSLDDQVGLEKLLELADHPERQVE